MDQSDGELGSERLSERKGVNKQNTDIIKTRTGDMMSGDVTVYGMCVCTVCVCMCECVCV